MVNDKITNWVKYFTVVLGILCFTNTHTNAYMSLIEEHRFTSKIKLN